MQLPMGSGLPRAKLNVAKPETADAMVLIHFCAQADVGERPRELARRVVFMQMLGASESVASIESSSSPLVLSTGGHNSRSTICVMLRPMLRPSSAAVMLGGMAGIDLSRLAVSRATISRSASPVMT